MAGFAFFGQRSCARWALPFRLSASRRLLLFWISFEMIFELRTQRKTNVATTAINLDHIRNVAASRWPSR